MTSRRSRERRFEAELDGRTIEVRVGEGTVTLNGRSVPFSCERLSERRLSLLIEGRSYTAVVLEENAGVSRVQIAGREFEVRLKTERDLLLERFGMAAAAGSGTLEVRAPMPGLVLAVGVEPGQEIDSDARLLVLEAMKMENEIRAPRAGIVKGVHVEPGAAVGKNELLIELE